MPINDVGQIAAAGLDVQAERLSTSAHNVANVNTDGYSPQRTVAVDSGGAGPRAVTQASGPVPVPPSLEDVSLPLSETDIVAEQVIRVEALNAFKANAEVIRTGEAMDKTLLDIIG